MVTELDYGGQAVMEGIMMRGKRHWTVCVRSPSGELVLHSEPLSHVIYRRRVLRWPFLRGLVGLWDSLGLGLRALIWSADVALGEDEDVSFAGPLAWGTVALSLGLGVGLFVLLPMILVSTLDQHIASPVLGNVAEGGVRLLLFVAYVAGIGFIPDVRRVFAYHGAEHKTINAYEDGAPLERTTVARYSRAHTRCGTGFLLMLLLVFVFLSTLMGRPPLMLRLLSRIVLIPVVAGFSYELLKLTAKYYKSNVLLRALAAPGLALQRLTTREPDPPMLEVGIRALEELLRCEGLLSQEGDKDGPAGDRAKPDPTPSAETDPSQEEGRTAVRPYLADLQALFAFPENKTGCLTRHEVQAGDTTGPARTQTSGESEDTWTPRFTVCG